jgi:hypothetical protein
MAAMPATEGMQQEKLESAVYKKFWQGDISHQGVRRLMD